MDPINEAYNKSITEASSVDDIVAKLQRMKQSNNASDFASLICDCIKAVYGENKHEYTKACKCIKERL